MMDIEAWLQRIVDFKDEIIEHIGRSAIALERIADSLAGIAKQNEIPDITEILMQHSKAIGATLQDILDSEHLNAGEKSIEIRKFQESLTSGSS